MAPHDLTERAKDLHRQLVLAPTRAAKEDNLKTIAAFLQQTRQDALREVAELHQEWRNGKHSGTFSDLLRHKLAQEG